MRFTWPLLALFLARFFASAAFFPAGDGDLAWQRWLGSSIRSTGQLPHAIGYETFTAPGAPWVPQEWLFSIFASLSSGLAWYAFAMAAAVCATAALYIGAARADRTKATPLALVAALSFAGFALCESFGVRVQVFAWPLLALFLYVLEFDSGVAYLAIPVTIVWSNVHASVMLAGPLALAAAIGSFLDERWSMRTKRTLLIGLGSLAATCCSPLGTSLPWYAIKLFSSPFKMLIMEWRHTDLTNLSFALGALPLLLTLAVVGISGAGRWRDRSIVLVTASLMFSAARNVPIFAIACFPIVIRSLCANVPVFAKRQLKAPTLADIYAQRLIPIFSLILGIAVAALLIDQSQTEAAVTDDLKPTLAAVGALPGVHNVFCADFAWCSFLIGKSRDRVFLDGRADPYPQDVWNDFDTIINVKAGWDAALRSHGTDVVVVKLKSQLEQVLELAHDWRSIFRNDTYRVWMVNPKAAYNR